MFSPDPSHLSCFYICVDPPSSCILRSEHATCYEDWHVQIIAAIMVFYDAISWLVGLFVQLDTHSRPGSGEHTPLIPEKQKDAPHLETFAETWPNDLGVLSAICIPLVYSYANNHPSSIQFAKSARPSHSLSSATSRSMQPARSIATGQVHVSCETQAEQSGIRSTTGSMALLSFTSSISSLEQMVSRAYATALASRSMYL